MPDFGLTKGFSAETSGGLLVMIDKEKASDFMGAAMDEFGQQTW